MGFGFKGTAFAQPGCSGLALIANWFGNNQHAIGWTHLVLEKVRTPGSAERWLGLHFT